LRGASTVWRGDYTNQYSETIQGGVFLPYHWTGHSSRLNRFFSWSLKPNSEAYAREELVAEIASMFLMLETGVRSTQEHFNNHIGYIASWISLLKSDPNAIFKAAQDARKATDFIMSFRDEATNEVKVAS
jgi:antirestriction protein ArdC